MPLPVDIIDLLHVYTTDLIKSFNLKEIGIDQKFSVNRLTFIESANISFPCILISVENEYELYKYGTTEEQDWEIPFSVLIVDKAPFRYQNTDVYTKLRTFLVNKFEDVDHRVHNIIRTLLNYKSIMEHEVMKAGQIMSGFRIRYWVRVGRRSSINYEPLVIPDCS